MVGMAVGNKQGAYLRQGNTGFFKLGQNAGAAAGVSQKKLIPVLHGKSGVVAFGYKGIART